MKHELLFDPLPDDPYPHGLVLYPVLGVTEEGVPVLPIASKTLVLDQIPSDDPSNWIAVCKTTSPQGQLVILGYVSRNAAAAAAGKKPEEDDVVIGTEKAQIRLTSDGRVRIYGEDVKVEARGRMALDGATIDLN